MTAKSSEQKNIAEGLAETQKAISQASQPFGPSPKPAPYRFFEKESGEEIPFSWISHEIEPLQLGMVIEVDKPDGKKAFYNVDRIDEGDQPMVQLVRARNTLWKTIMILLILGISWYAIQFIIGLF